MNWEMAKSLLLKNVRVGLHLNPEYTYKIVEEIPPYQCKNYDHHIGYRVKVGANSFINIPMSMMELLFTISLQNESIYNGSVFRSSYPHQAIIKPCHVHAIGKLFECAGIMERIGKWDYRILNNQPHE